MRAFFLCLVVMIPKVSAAEDCRNLPPPNCSEVNGVPESSDLVYYAGAQLADYQRRCSATLSQAVLLFGPEDSSNSSSTNPVLVAYGREMGVRGTPAQVEDAARASLENMGANSPVGEAPRRCINNRVANATGCTPTDYYTRDALNRAYAQSQDLLTIYNEARCLRRFTSGSLINGTAMGPNGQIQPLVPYGLRRPLQRCFVGRGGFDLVAAQMYCYRRRQERPRPTGPRSSSGTGANRGQ